MYARSLHTSLGVAYRRLICSNVLEFRLVEDLKHVGCSTMYKNAYTYDSETHHYIMSFYEDAVTLITDMLHASQFFFAFRYAFKD